MCTTGKETVYNTWTVHFTNCPWVKQHKGHNIARDSIKDQFRRICFTSNEQPNCIRFNWWKSQTVSNLSDLLSASFVRQRLLARCVLQWQLIPGQVVGVFSYCLKSTIHMWMVEIAIWVQRQLNGLREGDASQTHINADCVGNCCCSAQKCLAHSMRSN